MTDLYERKNADSYYGFYKLLKILIGYENMETFMEDATMRVTIFL